MAKTQKDTKTRQFEIPKGHIGIFFSYLGDCGLEYSLSEIDKENEELIVEVEYSPDERDEVMNLIELLDEYYEEETEQEED
ncbi:MAG: hypothetical protein H0W84_09130 [Bacteroidetes bacterium]|nr:hypothetical protein [Bacteroidota bacterium]